MNNGSTPTFFGVGVGPGDPDLLTLKSVEVLQRVDTIFTPKTTEDSESLALKIISGKIELSTKKVVPLILPMTKDKDILKNAHSKAAEVIKQNCLEGRSGAFITLGDPLFYSTFSYIMKSVLQIQKDIELVVIPGVTSLTATAAGGFLPLGEGDDKIAIVPATKKNISSLSTLLKDFETVVLMKVNKEIDSIVELLTREGMIDDAFLITRGSMTSEKKVSDLRSLKGKKIDYFSTLIVKRNYEQ